jgi:hypothetical protein
MGVAPTLSAWTIPTTAGTTIRATLSQSGCSPLAGTAGFTLYGCTATVASWAISGTTLTLTLSGKAYVSDNIAVAYSRSGAGSDAIHNGTDDYLADIQAVFPTNNSTQGDPAPIYDRIIKHIVGTLAGVTTGLGFQNTLICVRDTDAGQSPSEGLAVVIGGNPISADLPPLGLDEYRLPVGITVYDCQADSTTTSVMQRLASKAADVRKALMVDVHRGNQVINLDFDPDRYYPTENPRSVLITVNCIFRTLYGNPYQR